MKERRLSSIPINMVSQFVADVAITVPIIIVLANIVVENFGKGMGLCFGR